MIGPTRHTCNDSAGPYFGRLDPENCARCLELKQGHVARQWNRKMQREDFARALRNHDCKKRGCGPVCTFGDW